MAEKLTLQANPLNGSTDNVLNAIKFYFAPVVSQAARAIGVQVGFRTNEAEHYQQSYNPDSAENIDITKTYGVLMNMPMYGSLEFGNTDPSISENDYTGIDGKKYTFRNMVFPIAIVNAKQAKNVIKTKITGRDGEIKEYIGLNDWQITINSVIDMPADQAPLDFLHDFKQMLTAQVTIPVKNYYLHALGIDYVVIDDVDLGQAEGGYSSQPITITCCSDIPMTEFLP